MMGRTSFYRFNFALVVAFAVLHGAALGVAATRHAGLAPWLLLACALLSSSLWSLAHEAIHGHLLHSRTSSRRAGRVLAILHGAPFDVVRIGHLLHHAHSRTRRERGEVYDPERTSWRQAAPAYYLKLLGGLYALELASCVLIPLIPRGMMMRLSRMLERDDNLNGQTLRMLADPATLRAARIDALAVLALYGGGAWLLGAQAWMLAAMFAARAALISITDNVYHYRTPLEARHYAANLSLPEWMSLLLLRFNLHGVHHRHPDLPWFELHDRLDRPCEHGWFATLFAQLRGPVSSAQLLPTTPVSATDTPPVP